MNISKPFAVIFFILALGVFCFIVLLHAKNNTRTGITYEKSSSALVASSSSSEAMVLDDDLSIIPENSPLDVTYVAGVCGSEVPSTWHVRSKEDQAIWNVEGNSKPPVTLHADDFFRRFYDDGPLEFDIPLKPAVFSMAAADEKLMGHAEDPGAEDKNRAELDILSLSKAEFDALMARIHPAPLGYAWKTMTIGHDTVPVLRDVSVEQKYSGQELVFIAPDVTGRRSALIFFNRSTYWSDADISPFRKEVQHLLKTIDFASCPTEWFSR